MIHANSLMPIKKNAAIKSPARTLKKGVKTVHFQTYYQISVILLLIPIKFEAFSGPSLCMYYIHYITTTCTVSECSLI